MHILIINFTANWTAEEYDQGTTELAPVFAEVDGLIVKNFLFNHETKRMVVATCLIVRMTLKHIKKGKSLNLLLKILIGQTL